MGHYGLTRVHEKACWLTTASQGLVGESEVANQEIPSEQINPRGCHLKRSYRRTLNRPATETGGTLTLVTYNIGVREKFTGLTGGIIR